MKPNWDVVDEYEEGCAQAEDEPAPKHNASFLDDSRWDCSVILLPQLNADEANGEYSKDDEKSNDLAITPGVFRASPLKCEQKTDDAREEENGPDGIELFGTFLEPDGNFVLAFWRFEE